jgi:hypothetical protein
MIRARGNVGSSVWRSSIGRGEENPLLLMYTQRGIVQYKEASARGLITPSKTSGQLLGQAS